MRLAIPVLALTFLTGCAWFQAPGGAAGIAPSPEGTAGAPIAKKAAAEGEMCGGIAGFQCEEGLACIYEDGACHSIADAAGTCMKPGQFCTKEYRPVCGCDGDTYGNKCEAHAAGVSVAYPGECEVTGS